ncbi:DUF397 domain-containing protein [Streptomyces sp. NPDC091412]|uniref:DUF397 domain-containing protein n=1 Tax=unclassified Streptomyces TaxID=2593676 RepID=UPI001144699A|nr:DUF397 domain-containing protein [Streptomyces sp. 6-11-2]GED86790.1 hypothetical protein TNCT6_38750 [Streptomyces sp. 6-11-2]
MNVDLGGTEAPGPWVKSSYSNGAGGECVECAHDGGQVLVRDTKLGGTSVATIASPAWRAFTHAVSRGWSVGL